MRLPSFLIIGAAKSGTTALYRQLRTHPDIFMSHVKEPGFLIYEGHSLEFGGPGDMEAIGSCSINSLAEYLKLFDGSEGATAIGEASNVYLYEPAAAAAIRSQLPQVKLIAILRNPVDRAFSAYSMLIRDHREHLSFQDGLQQSAQRVEQGWSYMWDYLGGGLYAKQLKRYYELFPRSQILTLLYDDYLENPNGILNQVCRFLGVNPWTFGRVTANPSRDPDKWPLVRSERFNRFVNADSIPKNVVRAVFPTRILRRAGRGVRRLNMHVPIMDKQTRAHLLKYYEGDVVELEALTGHDLTPWRV